MLLRDNRGGSDWISGKGYTERVFGHWNRFPREMAMASSLLEFKKHLDDAFKHGLMFLGGPVWSQKLELVILVGPIQLTIGKKCQGFLVQMPWESVALSSVALT